MWLSARTTCENLGNFKLFLKRTNARAVETDGKYQLSMPVTVI